MKLAQIQEAQYYKAKSLRTLLGFFDEVENTVHPEMSGKAYEPKDDFAVFYIEQRKASTSHDAISRITTDRTGIWVDYKQQDTRGRPNGDWTNEEHLAKYVQIHKLGDPDEKGVARRVF